MRAQRPWSRGLVRAGLLAVGLLVPSLALASLSQGFATTQEVPIGSLVALDTKTTGNVVVADATISERLFGVAVAPSSADISLGGGDGQVQVSTTGSATALVSTAGGAIKVGDYIAVSPVAGVGQKAVTKSRVIGTAQADFDGKGTGVTKTKATVDGKQIDVSVGQIPVVISVTSYNPGQQGANYTVPPWLQNFSNALAGKNVSPVRIVVAALILIVALISISVLLYAGVRNSIISIGRNPLSHKSVFVGLGQVFLVAVVVLGLATAAMYLVLTR